MTRAKQQDKKLRKQYSEEYKREGLALAERVGVAVAARQLGVHESQLYGWRAKVRREQDQGEAQRQLAAENARLKRQLADQAEELAILKNVWSAPVSQVIYYNDGGNVFASMYPACW